MTEISATMVRDLREKTGAGMMDCKKALIECVGNLEEATDWLRKKGLAAAGKKSGRVTAEGVISIVNEGNKAVILELNAETDFVAKNDKFQHLAKSLANAALKSGATSVESFMNMKSPLGASTVREEIMEHVATIGENITLRRLQFVSVPNGVIGSYIHNFIAEGMGKIGVLIALESSSTSDEVKAFGKHLAMHIAATRPESLSITQLDQSLIERERAIFKDQALASGKPAEFIDKMVEGRIRKFYEEVVLMEQTFAIDGKTKISQMLADLSAKLGSEVKILSFIRFGLGEGVEKQENNFAAEVAAMAN